MTITAIVNYCARPLNYENGILCQADIDHVGTIF